MAEYLSPGVYVEEYDNSPRAVEGVGTSTAGFVGMAVHAQRQDMVQMAVHMVMRL